MLLLFSPDEKKTKTKSHFLLKTNLFTNFKLIITYT